ncbi:hypothetical protein TNCV_4215201 [Trichonephila clavipes]|nr:hypothetical protein TNCV_4215201 [Trichonephila clavipes]
MELSSLTFNFMLELAISSLLSLFSIRSLNNRTKDRKLDRRVVRTVSPANTFACQPQPVLVAPASTDTTSLWTGDPAWVSGKLTNPLNPEIHCFPTWQITAA